MYASACLKTDSRKSSFLFTHDTNGFFAETQINFKLREKILSLRHHLPDSSGALSAADEFLADPTAPPTSGRRGITKVVRRGAAVRPAGIIARHVHMPRHN